MKKYNQALLGFYNDHYADEMLFGTDDKWRPPLFAPQREKTGGILFVGMNPSTAGLKKATMHIGGKRKLSLEDAEKLAEAQKMAYQHKFFARRDESADKCWKEQSIAHLDLYPIRMKGKQAEALKAFEAVDQLKKSCVTLFKTGLEEHNPALVWIANLGVYEMLKKPDGEWRPAFDPVFGPNDEGEISKSPRIHVGHVKINGRSHIPVICSPQLSGLPYYTISCGHGEKAQEKWGKAYEKIRAWLDKWFEQPRDHHDS